MGTSGAMSTSNQYVKYNISIIENWQNTSENYSNVTVRVYFWRTNTGHETYGTGTISCKIDGTTYTENVSPSQKITSSGITLFEKTLNITHNGDGTKTLDTSAWININAPLSSNEQSYSQQLTTINPTPAPDYRVIITNAPEFDVEYEYYVEFTNIRSDCQYNFYIRAKNPNESSSGYLTIRVYPNYQSGQRLTLTTSQIDMIYDKLGDDLARDRYVDIQCWVETYKDGTCVGECPKETRGRITLRPPDILGSSDFNIEGEHWVTYKKYSEKFLCKIWSEARKAGSGEYVSVGELWDYESGSRISFNKNMVCSMYNMALPDTKPGCYLDIRHRIEIWKSKNAGDYIGASEPIVVKGYISGSTFAKVNGEWKKCVPYVKVGDSWRPTLGYTKVNGEWKQGIT